MERRAFLKVLAGLGIAIGLPKDIAAAPADAVDAAWSKATRAWTLYTVDDSGTISLANYEQPQIRRELYSLPAASAMTLEDLEGCEPLSYHVISGLTNTFEAAGIEPEAAEEVAYEIWPNWFKALSGPEREAFDRDIEAWLGEEPDWENEWEWFDRNSNPQGTAYSHFVSEDRDMCQALSIVVVDGRGPGGSYYYAELRTSPEAANAIAEERGYPIRFASA